MSAEVYFKILQKFHSVSHTLCPVELLVNIISMSVKEGGIYIVLRFFNIEFSRCMLLSMSAEVPYDSTILNPKMDAGL
jgi:hypothetical protein